MNNGQWARVNQGIQRGDLDAAGSYAYGNIWSAPSSPAAPGFQWQKVDGDQNVFTIPVKSGAPQILYQQVALNPPAPAPAPAPMQQQAPPEPAGPAPQPVAPRPAPGPAVANTATAAAAAQPDLAASGPPPRNTEWLEQELSKIRGERPQADVSAGLFEGRQPWQSSTPLDDGYPNDYKTRWGGEQEVEMNQSNASDPLAALTLQQEQDTRKDDEPREFAASAEFRDKLMGLWDDEDDGDRVSA